MALTSVTASFSSLRLQPAGSRPQRLSSGFSSALGGQKLTGMLPNNFKMSLIWQLVQVSLYLGEAQVASACLEMPSGPTTQPGHGGYILVDLVVKRYACPSFIP